MSGKRQVEAVRGRVSGDRGGGAVEYLGTLMLVASVCGVLVMSSLPAVVMEGIEQAICRVYSGACAQPDVYRLTEGAPQQRRPPPDQAQPSQPGTESSRPGPRRAELKVGYYDSEAGKIVWWDGGDLPAHYSQQVKDAYKYLEIIWDYFWDRFGRSSYDDTGLPMSVVIGWRDDTFFDSETRAVVVHPDLVTLDVLAHEIAHGYIKSTADLKYEHESGALNEAIADIFASNIDSGDWLIGEGGREGPFRDLSNPKRFDQSAHMDNYQIMPTSDNNSGASMWNDFGGVHTNSGIPNHFYFQMVQGIGRSKSEQIVYRAVTWYLGYLGRDSGFEDFRTANLWAAEDLHGKYSPEYRAVNEAFAKVGLDEGPVGPPPTMPGPPSSPPPSPPLNPRPIPQQEPSPRR